MISCYVEDCRPDVDEHREAKRFGGMCARRRTRVILLIVGRTINAGLLDPSHSSGVVH